MPLHRPGRTWTSPTTPVPRAPPTQGGAGEQVCRTQKHFREWGVLSGATSGSGKAGERERWSQRKEKHFRLIGATFLFTGLEGSWGVGYTGLFLAALHGHDQVCRALLLAESERMELL